MKKDLAKDSITEAMTSKRLFVKEYKKQMKSAATPTVQSGVKEYEKDEDYIFIAKTEKRKKAENLINKGSQLLIRLRKMGLEPIRPNEH